MMHSNHMGFVYVGIFFSFLIIFLMNVAWIILNLGYWATSGLQEWLGGLNLVESVYYSMYLRWILLMDVIWVCIAVGFVFTRRNYKTNPELYYLQSKPINDPKIAVILPTYNEEMAIN